MSKVSLIDKPHWMAWVTYLIYILAELAWMTACVGICTYLVFWKEQSGWWYLLAMLLCGNVIRPTEWVFGVAKPKDKDDE